MSVKAIRQRSGKPLISFIVKLVLAPLVLLSISSTGITYAQQATSDCIRLSCVDITGLATQSLFVNPKTGQSVLQNNSSKPDNPNNPKIDVSSLESPDGRYIGYLEYTPTIDLNGFTVFLAGIFIRAKATGHIVLVHTALITWVDVQQGWRSNRFPTINFLWSLDSKHLISASDHVLVVSNVDGSTEHTIRLDGKVRFYSLSPDGTFLPFGVWSNQGATLNFLSLSNFALVRFPPQPLTSIEGISTGNYSYDDVYDVAYWSPHGHWLVYMGLSEQRGVSTQVIMASPDSQKAFTIMIPDTWDRTLIHWSPTGRYVALLSLSDPKGQGPIRFDLLGVNGRLFPQILDQNTQIQPEFDLFRSDGQWWSIDGQSLMIWERSGALWNWIALDPDTGRLRLVRSSIVRNASVSNADATHYALTVQQGDKLNVLLANGDGQLQTILVAGADAIKSATLYPDILGPNGSLPVNPSWSYDGKRIVVAWNEIHGQQQYAHLTWANADGTNKHDIRTSFEEIPNYIFDSNNPNKLWFVAQQHQRFSIEQLNLYTERTASLFSDLPSSEVYNLQLISAPTGDVSALETSIDGLQYNNLYIVKPDQPSHLLHEGSNVSEVTWSPDGSMLAFLTSDSKNELSLHVVDSEGEHLSELNVGPDLGDLQWVICPKTLPDEVRISG